MTSAQLLTPSITWDLHLHHTTPGTLGGRVLPHFHPCPPFLKYPNLPELPSEFPQQYLYVALSGWLTKYVRSTVLFFNGFNITIILSFVNAIYRQLPSLGALSS